MLISTNYWYLQVNHVTRWYKPWFYKHVETFLSRGEGEEYIPLREYLLRHDKALSSWQYDNMMILLLTSGNLLGAGVHDPLR